jgi:guanine deaminase
MSVPDGAAVVDGRDRLVIPGLVNCHTHSHANIPRSLGDRWTLELALNANPAMRGAQSAEDKYVAAQLGAAEMISKGCTACYDLVYEFPEPSADGIAAVSKGYADAGMRAVVAPMVASRGFYEAIPGLIDCLPPEAQATARRTRFSSADRSIEIARRCFIEHDSHGGLVRLGIAPHSPLHTEDAFLLQVHALAEEFGAPLQTHLAESKVQAVTGLRRYGKTLTAHLADLNLLGPRFTAAHGVWLDDEDMSRLADAGASVSHNPASNMRYGNGTARVARMRDCGLRVGIGTDSRSCSDNLNMFEAMRLASFTSRIQAPDYLRWLTTSNVLAMATRESAKVLGMDDVGMIAAGYKADLVLLDLAHLNYVPLNSAVNQVVNAEDSTGVLSVMIGGRLVYENRRLLTVDVARLRDTAEAVMQRLRSVNKDAWALAMRLESVVGSFCVAIAREHYHVERYCSH